MVRLLKRSEAGWLSGTAGVSMRKWRTIMRHLTDAGIDPEDPLAAQVRAVHDALHTLSVIGHYASCNGGVGEQLEREL